MGFSLDERAMVLEATTALLGQESLEDENPPFLCNKQICVAPQPILKGRD